MRKRLYLSFCLCVLVIADVPLLSVVAFVKPPPAFAQTPPPSHTYYIHQDHVGSLLTVTDETGAAVKQSKYLPYGKVEAVNSAINDRLERGYTGQIRDNSTTLSYYNARYYDPVLSRFLSADSLAESVNRYTYVAGNPANYSDPSGNVRCPRGSKCWLKNKGSNPVQPPPLNLPPAAIPPATLTLGGGTLGYGELSNVYTPQAPWEQIEFQPPSNEVILAVTIGSAAVSAGGACAFGIVPVCAGINALLAAAFGEHVLSGGQSTTLTAPALIASSVATGGYMGSQFTQSVAAARSITRTAREVDTSVPAPPTFGSKAYWEAKYEEAVSAVRQTGVPVYDAKDRVSWEKMIRGLYPGESEKALQRLIRSGGFADTKLNLIGVLRTTAKGSVETLHHEFEHILYGPYNPYVHVSETKFAQLTELHAWSRLLKAPYVSELRPLAEVFVESLEEAMLIFRHGKR